MDKCLGCKEFDCDKDLCLTIPDVLMDECPCQECIVKSMCEHPCKEYDKFMKTKVDEHWVYQQAKGGNDVRKLRR